MMNQRLLIFRPTDILRLLTHYTDGQIPLTAEVKSVAVSRILQRMLMLSVESPEWPEGTGLENPFNVVYEGRKVISVDEKGQPVRAIDSPEAPRRQ